MNDWTRWNLQTWNERILSHFFRSNDERASPVVVLLATADELSRATGDTGANPDAVRDAFVEAVRLGIRRWKSLIEDGTDYEGWPGPPRRMLSPRFVAHLLFTCIAASESSEDLADEGSFVSRLRALTDDQLPEHSLQWLPRLWEHLRDWLAANEGRYRPLLLPDPGTFTRIGYTVKLAFPDRRDQRQLSEMLDRAGLAGHEPPVGRVLALVASERNRFRRSFLLAYDEFRRLFEASVGHTRPQLIQHRFWAAVREASLRGRGEATFSDVAVRLSLLGEEEEDRLALIAVADQQAETSELRFAELPVAYGPWKFTLVPRGNEIVDAFQLERTARAILDGSLRLPRVSSFVDQGLLPFVVGTHGLLELAGQDQLGDVSVALVRTTMAPDLLRMLGAGAATTRPSSYDGWVQVHDPTLRTLPSEELDLTTLKRTWILQESLSPTSIRLRGGIRVDDGWLGVHEVLPRVVAPGASTIVLNDASGDLPLNRLGDDTWGFPRRDLTGEFTLVAALDGSEDRRRIRFHAAPAAEAFKGPTEPDAWIVEEVSGTGTLSSSVPLTTSPTDTDCSQLCERTAYLAPDVGAFASTPEEAAWRVVSFGGTFTGARATLRGDSAIPSRWVASASARRRWRKILFHSSPPSSDPEFEQARRKIKGHAFADAHVPRADVQQLVPDLTPMRLSPPSSSVDRLVRIIAGRAASRSGIDLREWIELAQRVLEIDERVLKRVTRAWVESGLVDIASNARWWHRSLFARTPRIVAFKVGDRVGASLSGLTLTNTVDEMRRNAARIGVLVEDRFSVSSLVPQTISVRASDARALEELASACRLSLQWLDLGRVMRGVSSRHDGISAPPEHYERTSRWLKWSLKDGEYSDVLVEHSMRRDRPDYWLASRDGIGIWSYDLNITRAWAAALLGEPVVTAANAEFLEANHGFVPLPIARVVSILGPALPGPTDVATYRYPVGTPQLSELVLDIMSRTFDPSRLGVPTTQQATG
jgi:hypothetical protein